MRKHAVRPHFVNLMDGASALADLVHDILDLIGKAFVLTTNFIQLKYRFLSEKKFKTHIRLSKVKVQTS